METSELLKKVRKIEIKTRGLTRNIFAGEYHSAFKGRGIVFSEVREYQPGDDIRTIDWKVTARFNHPYVKVFQEERELTLMLIVDVSASESFGTKKWFKREMITEVAAVLAFSAMQNNDKIGILFFSDKIEKFIPPQKGTIHVLRIIRELLDFEPENKGTDIKEALRYYSKVIRKRSTVFLISDFIGSSYADAMKSVKSRHDLIAMQVFDPREMELPKVGLVRVRDAETGAEKWLDTSRKKIRNYYRKSWLQRRGDLEQFLKKNGIDFIALRSDRDYVVPLMNFFKSRF
ncbi:MAG: DUF58 domain-containing protein [Bacteroidetes bacterium]|nr:DUF58 domain-containing protein [Bacteroidota bacterium]